MSVQHTGTWSAINWLLDHKGIKGFLQEKHVNEVLEHGPGAVTHEIESMQIPALWHPLMVYHEHARLEDNSLTTSGYSRNAWWNRNLHPAQMILLTTIPSLIPMRDPLASVVTYQKLGEGDGQINGGNFSIKKHLDHWCGLAISWKSLRRFGHCRFLCWDLLNGSTTERSAQLLQISLNLGLQDPLPSTKWSDGRVINTAGEYPLKTAYVERDVETLRDGLSDNGFDRLREREPVLRPFLEDLGYQKLLWWSE